MRAYRKAYINGMFCPIVPRRDKQRLAHYKKQCGNVTAQALALVNKFTHAGKSHPDPRSTCNLFPDVSWRCAACADGMTAHDDVTHICQAIHLSYEHIFTQKTFVILCHIESMINQRRWVCNVSMKSNFSNALMAEWCLYQRIGTISIFDQYLNTCNTFSTGLSNIVMILIIFLFGKVIFPVGSMLSCPIWVSASNKLH